MNKIWKRILLLVFAVCCIGFAVYYFYIQRGKDTTPPEISFQTNTLEVTVSASDMDLLSGVTAWDAHDGDVTARIVVEGVSNLSSDQMATVTYAAFDQAGNVAKARRTLRYTDYESPKFTLTSPLIFCSGTSFDVLRYVGAEDVIDGSLDDRVKATLISGETAITAEGVHLVEFRVTNSMKDTSYMTVPVEVYPSGKYNATVTLTDYLVYVKIGSVFNSRDYLQQMQCGTEWIFLNNTQGSGVTVTVDSDVDTTTAGSYSVAYTVKNGNYTGYTRLIVIVEE